MNFFAVILTFVGILGLAGIGVKAQTDFSGTWEFERSTSIFISAKTYQCQLVITQNADNVVIFTKEHVSRLDKDSGKAITLFDKEYKLTHFLNGREEVNTLGNGTEIYSKTEWKKDKLKTTYFSGTENEKKKETLGTVEISLSKDGKRLLITKKGKPGNGIPYGYKPPVSQDDMMMIMLVNGSLANRKDTFRLVSN